MSRRSFLTQVTALVAITLFVGAAPALAAEGGDLARITNFAIVAAALTLALRKPLAGYLTARTEQIRAELKEAGEKTERAKTEHQRAEELLASLDSEVEKARAEAVQAAEAERERILKAAHTEAGRIKELATKEIDAEVEAGRRRLLARAAELSVSLAQEKIEKTMTDDDQSRLIDRSIEILASRD